MPSAYIHVATDTLAAT